ncbi:DUF1542 domain-containing protein [Vibrio splendidus]
MKLKLLSTLIAASFLAGCSSSGSSSNPPAAQDGIADVQYVEGEAFSAAVIDGDEGNHMAGLIQGSNGHTVISVDGVIYITDGDVVKNINGDTVGYIQTEDNAIIFQGNHGGEVVLTVENGRLIVSDVREPIDPDFGVPITPDTPIEIDPDFGLPLLPDHPIEIDPEFGLPITPEHPIIVDPDYGVGFEFEMIDDNKLVITLGASEVTITDAPTGVIISGDKGRSTVSVKTVNAYKEAMTHLTKEEQKFLALAFVANEGAGVINEDMRVKAWHTTKEMTKEWSQDNKLTMLKIANIEMDLQGNSLGYYLLTGERKTIDDLRSAAKAAISDAINDWIPAKPNLTAEQKAELKQKIQSLSQEQRQQIKQAVKDRASRS